MGDQFDNCTDISDLCPVEATTYGYFPNLPGNVLFLVVFAICTIIQLVMAIRHRTISFSVCVLVGCLCETVGYIGRVIMNNNPWDDAGFKMQIVCLILAPSFLAAGIYLTLKHMILALGPEKSRLPPKLYTWIFISFDALSILLQAVGGGLASAGGDLLDPGNDLMIAGVAVQVGTMTICVVLALDFAFALWKAKTLSARQMGSQPEYTNSTKGFYFYLTCTSLAFVAIYIRCIYRLPEMVGGWGNELMRKEYEFLILDGAMIALAAILMTLAPPGIFFPAMRSQPSESSYRDTKEMELMASSQRSYADDQSRNYSLT